MSSTPYTKRKLETEPSPSCIVDTKRMDNRVTPLKEQQKMTTYSDSEIQEIESLGAPDWAVIMMKRQTREFTELNKNFCSFKASTEEKLDTLNKTVTEQQRIIAEQERKIDDVTKRLEQIENYSRKTNLLFDNIEENTAENLNVVMNKLFRETLRIQTQLEISVCHRIGQISDAKKPRPVIVKFVRLQDRNIVWSARSKLKGSNIIMREHFSKTVELARKKMYPIYKQARSTPQVKKCSLVADKLSINGTLYTCNDMEKLPFGLNTPRPHTVHKNGNTYFFTKESPLSNFHTSNFTLDGIKYCNVEQFYQSKKAEHFGFDDITQKMMATSDPAKVKSLARKIKTPEKDEKKWYESYAQNVMARGVAAKFNQNPTLARYLTEQTGTVIAEASTDTFFGTGLTLNDPDLYQSSKWSGQNILGNILQDTKSLLAGRMKDEGSKLA